MFLIDFCQNIRWLISSFLQPVDVYREYERIGDEELKQLCSRLFRRRLIERYEDLGRILCQFMVDHKKDDLMLSGEVAYNIFMGSSSNCYKENIDLYITPCYHLSELRKQLRIYLLSLNDQDEGDMKVMRNIVNVNVNNIIPNANYKDYLLISEILRNPEVLGDLREPEEITITKSIKDREYMEIIIRITQLGTDFFSMVSMPNQFLHDLSDKSNLFVPKDCIDAINRSFLVSTHKIGFDGSDLFISKDCIDSINRRSE